MSVNDVIEIHWVQQRVEMDVGEALSGPAATEPAGAMAAEDGARLSHDGKA